MTPIPEIRIAIIQDWLNDCFNAPPKCPLFNRWPDLRLIRRQRREACLTLLRTLIRHLDRTTLCFGFLHPNGQFQNLTMKHIVLETGLGQRRCERVIVDLKALQALEMKSPGQGQCPALAFTERFVEWMLWSSSLWAMEHGRQSGQSASGPDEVRP